MQAHGIILRRKGIALVRIGMIVSMKYAGNCHKKRKLLSFPGSFSRAERLLLIPVPVAHVFYQLLSEFVFGLEQ